MGKLIAFEALDKAGKETQTKLLVDWLNSKKHDAVRLSFPAYDTPIGKEIKASLYNERDYNQREFQMLLEMNRYEMQTVISEYLKQYAFVILDRYHLSGLAYGAAGGIDIELWKGLQTNLIKPHLGIFLHISPMTSFNRKRPNEEPDRYESDLEFLKKVYLKYIQFTSEYGYVDIDGEESISEVFAEITKTMQNFFPQIL